MDAVGDRATRRRRRRHQRHRALRRAGPSRPRSSAPTALLLVTPYYNKPSQAGVARTTSARSSSASDVPVMLYDVPGRTGTPDRPRRPTRAIAERRPVVAVKDAVGDFARGVRIMQELGLRRLLRRRRAQPRLAGARRAAASSRVVGHAAGDADPPPWSTTSSTATTAAALETYQRLLPAIDAIMGVPNYGATTAKACLQLLGVLDNRNVRGPLVPLDRRRGRRRSAPASRPPSSCDLLRRDTP